MIQAGDTPAIQRFAYHRSISPMIGVLLGLAVAETCVVHVVALAIWGWRVAVVLAVIDLSAVVMLVRLLRSFRRLPVRIEGRRLTMRAGTLRSITIDIDDIAGFRTEWDHAAIKRRDMLNLALMAWPNIVLDLKRPAEVRRGRNITAIAHRLDDPASFHAAIAELERPHGERGGIAGA